MGAAWATRRGLLRDHQRRVRVGSDCVGDGEEAAVRREAREAIRMVVGGREGVAAGVCAWIDAALADLEKESMPDERRAS